MKIYNDYCINTIKFIHLKNGNLNNINSNDNDSKSDIITSNINISNTKQNYKINNKNYNFIIL